MERATRVETLLAELTLEEKAALMAGADLWHSVAVPRLGIGVLRVTDGPNGARGTAFRGGPTSACFPCGSALGSTWNPALVERVAAALAEETLAKGARVLLAPTVNIQRTPIGGRDFECYSEDPELSARLTVAFVRGLQARGVGACVKHFVANDVEWERHRASAEMDERTLREVYLVAVRGRGARGRRVDGDGRLQPPRRHALHRAPAAAHRHPARRVGLRRRGDLGLVRDAVDGAVGEGRHGSRDAGSAAPLRRQDRGRGETRRADRGGRRRCVRRILALLAKTGALDERRTASTHPSRRSTAPSTARSRARPPPTRSCCSATKRARCRSTQRSGASR